MKILQPCTRSKYAQSHNKHVLPKSLRRIIYGRIKRMSRMRLFYFYFIFSLHLHFVVYFHLHCRHLADLQFIYKLRTNKWVTAVPLVVALSCFHVIFPALYVIICDNKPIWVVLKSCKLRCTQYAATSSECHGTDIMNIHLIAGTPLQPTKYDFIYFSVYLQHNYLSIHTRILTDSLLEYKWTLIGRLTQYSVNFRC